jgi:hypothetical protein
LARCSNGIAHAHGQDVAAAAEPVERRGLLGNHDRVQHRQKHDRRADLHPVGLGHQPGEQRHGLEHLHRRGQEMLRRPQRIEAVQARHAHLGQQVVELRPQVGALRPLRGDVDAEFHGVVLPRRIFRPRKARRKGGPG